MFRLALACDLREEGWTSMDLVGDMLFEHLARHHRETVQVEQLVPRFHNRFSLIPGSRKVRAAWNADRMINRLVDYPHWLKRKVPEYDMFHVVDHSYAQLTLTLPARRTLVTLHDLDAFRCLIDPQRYPRPKWFRAMMGRVLRGLEKAAGVVCVSNAVRDEVFSYGLLPAEKVNVIYNGVHPSCDVIPKPEADSEAAKLLGLSSDVPVVLHVGSTIPRKRIDVLLQAFAQIGSSLPSAVLVRIGGSFNPQQVRLVRDLHLEERIKELPFLTRDVLAAIYRRADVLLQTSDSEGFGLPVAEAMACGCPVVASNLPVLREIGGRAATYCKPADASAFAEAAVQILNERSNGLSSFEQRREALLSNAAKYSWRETAKQFLNLYQTVLNQS